MHCTRPLTLASAGVLLVLASHAAPPQDPARRIDGAAKPALTLEDCDAWQSLRGPVLSRDGSWVAFQIEPQVGDGELVVRESAGEVLHRFPRGSSPQFSPDARFVVFRVEAPYALRKAFELEEVREKVRKAKEAKLGGETAAEPGEKGEKSEKSEKKEAPKGHHVVFDLATGKAHEIRGAKTFRLPERGPAVLVYELEKEKPKKPEAKKEGDANKPAEPEKPAEPPGEEKPAGGSAAAEPPAKKPAAPRWHKDGAPLVVRDLETEKETRFEGVVQWSVLAKRAILLFSANSKKDDEKIERGLFALDLATGQRTRLIEGAAEHRGFANDRDETRIAFYSNRRDREAEPPVFDVWTWDLEASPCELVLAGTGEHRAFPGHRPESAVPLRFSRDGSVVLVHFEPDPPPDLDPLLPDDEVNLDLWHWRDPLLQPMQARRNAELARRGFAAAYHGTERALVRVTEGARDDLSFLTRDGARLLLSDGEPYAPLVSWDGSYSDVYVVSALDGSRRKILEAQRGRVSSSPGGRWLLAWDGSRWWCYDVESGAKRDLTGALPVSFVETPWDTPQPAPACGIAGWTQDDASVLLYDEFDVWEVRPDGTGAVCVTDGLGRATQTELRYVSLDREQEFIPAERPVLLSALDKRTKASGYYEDRLREVSKPKRLAMEDARFGRVQRAEESERLFFTLETYVRSPDLYTCDVRFGARRQLSELNPEQASFRWGSAEQVRWSSGDGRELDGILIKPEGFDRSQRYPLMVYFYEKLSESLHSYRAPAPGTSPNPTLFVSQGYLWFMPDVHYEVGYPGESALKCIVSGVQHLIDQGFVDKHAIGAAGHSWGGYQTAYLVTCTDIFAAVESGAPVSNMTSAYGGIRYGTGMSRAFQYERTQSRIGATLWEAPMRYIDNSPIFRADRVRTPVLMLHNDQDGAVPWTQGIEYFCALRRLGKEAYLFNYRGQDHGLRRRADMLDWSLRVQQFFDHHLRGEPAPAWMQDGVSHPNREREKRSFRAVDYSAFEAAAEAERAPERNGGTPTSLPRKRLERM